MEQEHVLQELAEGFSMPLIGNEFFNSLCQLLLKILHVEYVCVSKLTKGGRWAETLSYWSRNGVLPNVEYEIENTPSEKIISRQDFCSFSSDVQELFPKDKFLKDLHIESYSGIPVYDIPGNVIGLIIALDTSPLPDPKYVQNLFKVVSKRVELEMIRVIDEEKLRQNEAQLNEAQQIANVGSFEWDIPTGYLKWSDQLYRIFGYSPGEIEVDLDLYLKHVHPEYLETIKNELEHCIKNCSPFDNEYRILDKQGNEKILRSTGKISLKNGFPEKIFGVCHDVTKSKNAEYDLKKLNAELEDRVSKRTESLAKSLFRERLIREISELTTGQLDTDEDILHQIAKKAAVFLKADGLQLFRVGSELDMEYLLSGEYCAVAKNEYKDLLPVLAPEIAYKGTDEKNVQLLLKSVNDLSEETRGKIPANIKALLVMEFFQNSRPYSLLLMYHCSVREWENDEVQFLEEILNHLGGALFKADILKKKDKAVEEYLTSQNKLKLITDGTPAFISYMDKDLNYQYVNKFYLDFFEMNGKNVIGKNVRDVLSNETYKISSPNHRKVLEGKKVHFENILTDAKGEKHEVEVQFIPEIQNDKVNGIIVLGTIITDRKKIERKLKESEERLRLALDASLLGAWDFDLVSDKLIWDERCRQMFGLPSRLSLNYSMFLNGLHPDDRQRINSKIRETLRPGGSGFFDEEFRTKGEETRWIRSTGRALFRNGKPYRFIGISQDITRNKLAEIELKEIQCKLEQKNKMLETLQHVGRIISGELEHKKVVQTITDAATSLIGAEFGTFIYNSDHQDQPSYQLFALSGKMFSSFKHFPVQRNSKIFSPTFEEKKIVRYQDISRESVLEQNNPFLRSYIAVPVFSKQSKVVGGLFFGHSNPDIFTEESENILEGIATQAAIALDNAQLFEEAQAAKIHAEQQRNYLYSIFDLAPSLISVCKGKDFIYEFVNKEYEKYFPETDLLGQSWRKRLIEEDRRDFVSILDHVFNTGETYNGKEVPVEIVENGEYKIYYYDFIIQAQRDEKKKIEGIITYAIDISEQVHARKTIEEFMSVASHELKTPLTTVMAYSELLEDELNEKGLEQKSQYISKMNSNLNKLNNLISDLLDVSRIQSGKMAYKKKKIDFDEFIRQSLDNVKYTSKSHNIKLSGYTGATILGDPERLDQAVANIVSNAIKYSPKANEILVELKRHKDEVQALFTDYGMGIPKEEMHHLFQRFYRIKEKGTSGLGIGLYITKEIIDLHSGKITVESTPGEGTTFSVFLPVTNN